MEYKNHNTDLLKRTCQLCGGPLRMIGIQRKNGKNIIMDWNTRKYHKACYKKIV